MIIRCWTAQLVSEADAPFYAAHLEVYVLPALRRIDGYIGARLLRRATDDGPEIIVVTLWRSLAAIAKFAGDDLEKAVVEDNILPLLQRYDQRVRHYQLVLVDNA